ncbi:MAG: hypothetical protein ACLGXA_20455 [Acidobacteriota bacterium]
MALGSVLQLSEDLLVAPRPTLVPRPAEDPQAPLIPSTHKAVLQGSLIQREGQTFLWFTFPKAHVFVPVVQAQDPSLPSRIEQVLQRQGSVAPEAPRRVETPSEPAEAATAMARAAHAF